MSTSEHDAAEIYSKLFIDDRLCLCHYLSKSTGKRLIGVRFDYLPWGDFLKIEQFLVKNGFYYLSERKGRAWYAAEGSP